MVEDTTPVDPNEDDLPDPEPIDGEDPAEPEFEPRNDEVTPDE